MRLCKKKIRKIKAQQQLDLFSKDNKIILINSQGESQPFIGQEGKHINESSMVNWGGPSRLESGKRGAYLQERQEEGSRELQTS